MGVEKHNDLISNAAATYARQKTEYEAHCKAVRDDLDSRLAAKDMPLGAEIPWNPDAVMHPNDPPLGNVWADNHGRLWRQKHHDGVNTLVRIW